MMNELLEKLSREIAKTWDDFVLTQFERYGYSMQDIEELGKQGRLMIKEYSSTKTFCVDEEELFIIENLGSGMDETGTRFLTKLRCVYVKEPIKKGAQNYDDN